MYFEKEGYVANCKSDGWQLFLATAKYFVVGMNHSLL